jgi:hypothetical protein
MTRTMRIPEEMFRGICIVRVIRGKVRPRPSRELPFRDIIRLLSTESPLFLSLLTRVIFSGTAGFRRA